MFFKSRATATARTGICILHTLGLYANLAYGSIHGVQVQLPRHLSYVRIVGYEPGSDVMSHLRIDLDQEEMEEHLSREDFAAAKAVYTLGGNSGATAVITVSALNATLEKDAIVKQGGVMGYMKASAEKEATVIHVTYMTVCKEGGLSKKDTSGCFAAGGGNISVDDVDVGVPLRIDNTYRTLQGFSMRGQYEMGGWLMQEFYAVFRAYYGQGDYAHQHVMAALEKTGICATCDVEARVELAKRTSVYMSVWMYIIRAMEDAILHCRNGCVGCKYIHDLSGGAFVDDTVHAWDEAVAYYAGSIEGPGEGGNSGNLLYELADRRCSDFGTCTEGFGRSAVNFQILEQFKIGQYYLLTGRCVEPIAIKRRIVELMSVPLVQGSLLYAYKVDKLQSGSKERAAAAAFSAAILPRIATCSPRAAEIISDNMKIDSPSPMSSGFAEVKNAFESTYACLGITCKDVGNLIIVPDSFAPCRAAVESDVESVADEQESVSPWIPVVISICAVFLSVACCVAAYMLGMRNGWRHRKMSCAVDGPPSTEESTNVVGTPVGVVPPVNVVGNTVGVTMGTTVQSDEKGGLLTCVDQGVQVGSPLVGASLCVASTSAKE